MLCEYDTGYWVLGTGYLVLDVGYGKSSSDWSRRQLTKLLNC